MNAETAKCWRRRPESNRGGRICNPLRNHSATSPTGDHLAGASVLVYRRSTGLGDAMTIYLNACGHGLSDPAVAARMAGHLAREAAVGEARAAVEVVEELDGVRAAAAALIGASVAQTGLASNTSAPWQAVVARVPLTGRRIVVAAHEWGDNVEMLRWMAGQVGARVHVVPAPDALDPAAWAARMDADVAALFCPMVTSVAGIRYPVEGIGALARPDDALFIVDAAQAVGQGVVDAPGIGCDVLVATTRKWLRGPRETGLYWLNERASAVTGLRAGLSDMNAALRLGQGVALRLALDEVPEERLTGRLRGGIALEPLCSDTGAVTLRIPHDRAAVVRAALDADGIFAKWPDPVADEPGSGVTLAEGALLRLSPHAYNTEAEIDRVIAAVGAGLR